MLKQHRSESSGRFGWLRKRSFLVIAATAAILACTPGATGAPPAVDSAEVLEAYGIDAAVVRLFIDNGGKLPPGYEAKLEMLTESQTFVDLVAASGATIRNDDSKFTMPAGTTQGDTDIEVLIRVAADLGILSDSAQQAFVMASVQPTPTAPVIVVALGQPDNEGSEFFDSASALRLPDNPSSGDSAEADPFNDAPVIGSALRLPPSNSSDSPPGSSERVDDADDFDAPTTDSTDSGDDDSGISGQSDNNENSEGKSATIASTDLGDDDDSKDKNNGNSGGDGDDGTDNDTGKPDVIVSMDSGDDQADDKGEDKGKGKKKDDKPVVDEPVADQSDGKGKGKGKGKGNKKDDKPVIDEPVADQSDDKGKDKGKGKDKDKKKDDKPVVDEPVADQSDDKGKDKGKGKGKGKNK